MSGVATRCVLVLSPAPPRPAGSLSVVPWCTQSKTPVPRTAAPRQLLHVNAGDRRHGARPSLWGSWPWGGHVPAPPQLCRRGQRVRRQLLLECVGSQGERSGLVSAVTAHSQRSTRRSVWCTDAGLLLHAASGSTMDAASGRARLSPPPSPTHARFPS
jgi:hypothetical protein